MKYLDIKLPEELSELLRAVREQEQVKNILNKLITEADSCKGITPLTDEECCDYGVEKGGRISLLLGMFREKIISKDFEKVNIKSDFVPTSWAEFFSEDNIDAKRTL
jgi:hypothetical protein